MACLENLCTRCHWQGFSNAPVLVCPCCSHEVINLSDEDEPFESNEELDNE